ncbi:MAG: zinc ribbon domain-containing protein [Anaerolineae bacterium]|nr:zinc ribbon domain-containing protein [Anaerolineae bacterium]
MDQLFIIVAGVSLVGLTVLWILRPLLGGAEVDRERSPEANAVADLAAQHEVALKSLRDLDNDYTAGKLDDADYQAQRALLLSEGVAILQRLDELKAGWAASDPTLDTEIETAVAARRVVTPSDTIPPPTCPTCGAQVRVAARFCDQCGATLVVPTASPPVAPLPKSG